MAIASPTASSAVDAALMSILIVCNRLWRGLLWSDLLWVLFGVLIVDAIRLSHNPPIKRGFYLMSCWRWS